MNYLVNVPSPFPRERRDRDYGPFETQEAADAWRDTLPTAWRAKTRPIHPIEAVIAP